MAQYEVPETKEKRDLGKIRKVTIEWDNATFIAEGQDAEDWNADVEGIHELARAHGYYEAKFKWTKIIRKCGDTPIG